MCSDGMLEEMEDRELVNILSLPQPDARKVRILKEATKENRDNHSAWLIRIESAGGDRQSAPGRMDAAVAAVSRPRGLAVLAALVLLVVLGAIILLFRG